MTVKYTADVFCDHCGRWVSGVTGHSATGLATAAVKEAKRWGWSRQKNSTYLDLCPDCLKAIRKLEVKP